MWLLAGYLTAQSMSNEHNGRIGSYPFFAIATSEPVDSKDAPIWRRQQLPAVLWIGKQLPDNCTENPLLAVLPASAEP